KMSLSRRRFFKNAFTASALGMFTRGTLLPVAAGARVEAYRPSLLPSQKEVWDWQLWMAKLGPKDTGNPAHTQVVEVRAQHLKESGLEVTREHYTFPRWDARRWDIRIQPQSGASFKAPVTSYFPYSGETPAAGVSAELVYAGHNPSFNLSGLQGKIALIDFAT